MQELPPSLKVRIEDDLGLIGNDLAELLEEFSETYHVDIANFDFTGLISPEGLNSLGCALAVPMSFYWLTAWLLKTMVAGLGWPLDNSLARRIWQWPIPLPTFGASDRLPALTVGDFVASAAAGHFVQRAQVRFRLVVSS